MIESEWYLIWCGGIFPLRYISLCSRQMCCVCANQLNMGISCITHIFFTRTMASVCACVCQRMRAIGFKDKTTGRMPCVIVFGHNVNRNRHKSHSNGSSNTCTVSVSTTRQWTNRRFQMQGLVPVALTLLCVWGFLVRFAFISMTCWII